MKSDSDLKERYYDLLRLQRRVNHTLDTHVEAGGADLKAAEDALAREVDRLVRVEADPAVFDAIQKAAWETQDGGGFADSAREIQARLKLQSLTAQHGTKSAFRKSLKESEQKLQQKEAELDKLGKSTDELDARLSPVLKFNESVTFELVPANRAKIEESGWLSRMDNRDLSDAYAVFKKYGKDHGYYSGDRYHSANCFDDMERLSREKEELRSLGPQIDSLRDEHYKRLSAYREMDEARQTLSACGVKEDARFDLAAFQKGLIARLTDSNFLNAFARHTASGVGGQVIMMAINVSMRREMQGNLQSYRKQVGDTTRLLEGPIGSIAKAAGVDRTIDGIEKDIRAQALMAGYLCIASAECISALAAFRPEHTEGPASLTRDLQMHMVVNGGVDPAYIKEIFGMDGTLSKIFNVNAARPVPDFKGVLSRSVPVERIDRVYGEFLKENADDADLHAAGFAAGQFDVISFEKFLGRYFPSGTSFANIAEALLKEAEEIKKVGDQRVSMGISRDGPRVLSLNG